MEKTLFKETIQITNLVKKTIKMKEDVGEGSNGFFYEKVPVWRLDTENLNGRIYTTQLGERIVAENAITNVLRNHIDDFQAEIADIKAIAKNPVIEDGFLKVDIQMVDYAFANHIENIVSAGGRVGLSSVGYGYLNDNKEVEDYTLVRYADFVINPSAFVYIEAPQEDENPVNEESVEPEVQIEETDQTEIVETSNVEEETTVSNEVISPDELEDIKKRFEVKKNGKH